MNNKLKEPSRSIELNSVTKQLGLIKDLINNANIEIKKHNAIVADSNTEKTSLIADIWKYLVEENKKTIVDFNKKSDELQKEIKALEESKAKLLDEYKQKDAEIKDKTKNITSVQPSVDAINKLLTNFGFDNFKIVSSGTEDNYYHIEREDGTIAEKTLSEGEITFITFLHADNPHR